MSKFICLLSASALIIYVAARCDNQCSGHGFCMTDDVCQCYDNFGSGLSHDSGDCSDRICPYEIAWVDSPDLTGRFHKYMECAGKGICDRTAGDCTCFDGFEGKGCQRAMCPNDCSGHGTCEYIEDLPYGATWNDWIDTSSPVPSMRSRTVSGFSDQAKLFEYDLWDKKKSRKCVCDATYGDVDCSKRLCPFGTDVLDTKDDTWWGLDEQKHQEQTILFSSLTGDFEDFADKTFALTFTSQLNETFTTIPIRTSTLSSFEDSQTDLENDIKLALLRLPNGVIDGVSVKVTYVDQITADLVHSNAVISANLRFNATNVNTVELYGNSGNWVGGAHPVVGQFVVGYGVAAGSKVAFINETDGVVVKIFLTPNSKAADAIATSTPTSYKLIGSIYETGSYKQNIGRVVGPRGVYEDFSQQVPSGQDEPVLNTDSRGVPINHRRLSNSGLMSIKIRFTGAAVQGPQHLLVVEDYLCEAGCTPKLTGLPVETRNNNPDLTDNAPKIWSTVVQVTKSDYNSFECGRRGKCDYSSGLCSCFAGYVGDNCNTLTTLV